MVFAFFCHHLSDSKCIFISIVMRTLFRSRHFFFSFFSVANNIIIVYCSVGEELICAL